MVRSATLYKSYNLGVRLFKSVSVAVKLVWIFLASLLLNASEKCCVTYDSDSERESVGLAVNKSRQPAHWPAIWFQSRRGLGPIPD